MPPLFICRQKITEGEYSGWCVNESALALIFSSLFSTLSLIFTRIQLDDFPLQPNRLRQRNAVSLLCPHPSCAISFPLPPPILRHFTPSRDVRYPPESDRERRIRFVSEVNAMASIKSKHTVPLLGIMFGVQGQEESLGLSIGMRQPAFFADFHWI